MADRRMFSKWLVDSDLFMDMPTSSQALYFHLGVRADDDGFVANPKRIAEMIGSSRDDLKILIAKGFVIGFSSGVIVITHWKVNNQIRKDRYKPTIFQEEKAMLELKEVSTYTFYALASHDDQYLP